MSRKPKLTSLHCENCRHFAARRTAQRWQHVLPGIGEPRPVILTQQGRHGGNCQLTTQQQQSTGRRSIVLCKAVENVRVKGQAVIDSHVSEFGRFAGFCRALLDLGHFLTFFVRQNVPIRVVWFAFRGHSFLIRMQSEISDTTNNAVPKAVSACK